MQKTHLHVQHCRQICFYVKLYTLQYIVLCNVSTVQYRIPYRPTIEENCWTVNHEQSWQQFAARWFIALYLTRQQLLSNLFPGNIHLVWLLDMWSQVLRFHQIILLFMAPDWLILKVYLRVSPRLRAALCVDPVMALELELQVYISNLLCCYGDWLLWKWHCYIFMLYLNNVLST